MLPGPLTQACGRERVSFNNTLKDLFSEGLYCFCLVRNASLWRAEIAIETATCPEYLKNQLHRQSHRPWAAEAVERREATTRETAAAHRRRLPEREVLPDRGS